jgi:gamma-tubulin complex component 2
MSTCLMFRTFTPQGARSLHSTDPGPLAPQGGSSNQLDLTKLEKLEDVLKKYDENFSHHLDEDSMECAELLCGY